MRALAIAIVLFARVAVADGPRTSPVGFDHTVHDRDVVVNGGEPIACAKCHEEKAGRLVGRPGHAACFAGCHAPAPVTPRAGAKLVLDADRTKLCTNCHAEASLVAPFTGKLGVTYPPYRIDRDFNIVIGHKQHRDFACTQCHDLGGKKPAPHARCAGCHDGSAAKNHSTAMAQCAICHPAASGTPQPPELAVVHDSVTAVFSHASHAARGGAGKDCVTCHAPIKAADETVTELPRPNANDCAHCHDGKQAFGVLVACTRCHDKAPAKFEVERPDKRFAHGGSHAQLVADKACTACHSLDAKTGETQIAGHAICTECHADDFGARHPTRCGACHLATEPWRKLRADRAPDRAQTEFGAAIDHGKHRGDCASCHVKAGLHPPRGHGSCTGTTCHAATGGPAPQLSACKTCHQLGLVAARLAKRATEPWSVRLAFDHGPHQKDGAGAPLACATCHTALGGSVVDLPTPKKPACEPCHDGKQAFKLTGTTCKRCHTGGA